MVWIAIKSRLGHLAAFWWNYAQRSDSEDGILVIEDGMSGGHSGTLSSQIQVWYLLGTRILTTSFTAVEESGFCQWSGRLCAQNNMKVTVVDSCSLSRGPNAPTYTKYLLVGSTGSCFLMPGQCCS